MAATSSDAPPVLYRPAAVADLEAEASIFLRAEGGLVRAHAFEWNDRPIEALTPDLGHLLTHDPSRCFVAEIEGRVVGFTAALTRDDLWFFASLFIDPDAQGRGIGRRLFELAHDSAPSRQATLTDSFQPVSNTLYARHGLIPTAPMLGFVGPPGWQAPPGPADMDATDGSTSDLRDLDLAAYGADRRVDHEYWSSRAERSVWVRGDRPVAYSYAWPSGRIGPIAGTNAEAAADALRCELARHPGAWTEIPGSARALVGAALDMGLRLDAPVGLLLLSESFPVPNNLAVSGWFLF